MENFDGIEIAFLCTTVVQLFGFTILIYRIVQQVKSEEETSSGLGDLHPVGITKFIILSLATSNMYSAYWFWRCWRRHRFIYKEDISPFWRALFSPFWIYPLFKVANTKSELKWPDWIGISVAILYFLVNVGSAVIDRITTSGWAFASITAAATITVVPVVSIVNRINDPALVSEHSRFETRHWLALLVSVPYVTLLLMQN